MTPRILAVVAACLALSACVAPPSDVPAPAPDHGPEVGGCVGTPRPFVDIRIAVLDNTTHYAARVVKLTLTSVDTDGADVAFEDRKTGETTPLLFHKPITTSQLSATHVCVEYPTNAIAYLEVQATLTGQTGDSIEISTTDPTGAQLPVVDDAPYRMFAIIDESRQVGTATCTSRVRLF